MYTIYANPREIKTLARGGRRWTGELLANDNCWEAQAVFFKGVSPNKLVGGHRFKAAHIVFNIYVCAITHIYMYMYVCYIHIHMYVCMCVIYTYILECVYF